MREYTFWITIITKFGETSIGVKVIAGQLHTALHKAGKVIMTRTKGGIKQQKNIFIKLLEVKQL